MSSFMYDAFASLRFLNFNAIQQTEWRNGAGREEVADVTRLCSKQYFVLMSTQIVL